MTTLAQDLTWSGHLLSSLCEITPPWPRSGWETGAFLTTESEVSVMNSYIGTKIVKAGMEMKDGRDGYAVVYEDGYRSWSPKETFERAYRLVTDAEKASLLA